MKTATGDSRSFHVLLTSETAIKCQSEFGFEFTDEEGRQGSIACANWEEVVNGVSAHRGLQFQVEIGAATLDSAVSGAGNVTEALLTALTLDTSGSSDEAKADVAYDSTDGIGEREFWQRFEPRLLGRPVKVTDGKFAAEIVETVSQLDKHKDRLIRAGIALRRGLRAGDGLSRFSEYWIGLECLNPPLQKRLSSETTKWSCECGKEYKREEATGIRDYLIAMHGEDVWKRVKKLRRDIFHGTEALHVIQAEATELAAVLEEALNKATLFCLGKSLKDLASLKITSLPAFAGPTIHFRATLLGDDVRTLGLGGRHPHFRLRSEVVGARQEGNVRYEQMSHRFTPELGCPAKPVGVTTVFPKGMTVQHKSAALLSADGTSTPLETDSGDEQALVDGSEAR